MSKANLVLVHDGALPPLTPDQLHDQDGEPRVLDLTLAERLGMNDLHDVRRLIERNRIELETYGEVRGAVCQTNRGQISTREVETRISGTLPEKKRRGRPGKAYHLNEGQALVICALSRTPQAAAVRRQIIDVFMAYRRGVLPVEEEQQQTIAQLAAELAELRQRVALIGAAPHIRAVYKGSYLPGTVALTVQDISLQWDDPRILDERLSVQLGIVDVQAVRKLIRSHRSLLAGLGKVVSASGIPGNRRGHGAGPYWLTELQALAVCGLVSGNIASVTRTRVIKVFSEFRRGQEELAAAGGIREVRNNSEMVAMLDERVAALEANARTEARQEVRRQRVRAPKEPVESDGDLLFGISAISDFLGTRWSQTHALIRAEQLPHFRLAGRVCSRKTLLGPWLDRKEAGNA